MSKGQTHNLNYNPPPPQTTFFSEGHVWRTQPGCSKEINRWREGKTLPQKNKRLLKWARTPPPLTSLGERARVTRRRSPVPCVFAQGHGARARRWCGRPNSFPPAPSLTCLTKNLPSSLRLFSFLAAINRSGAAATSSKRCSMITGPPPRAATGAPCFALRTPEPLRYPRRSCHRLRLQ